MGELPLGVDVWAVVAMVVVVPVTVVAMLLMLTDMG
jgi:hypothetical protein